MATSYALLLLPPPPNPGTPPAIRAAFKPPVEAALRKIAQRNLSNKEPILDIALPCPVRRSAIEFSDREKTFQTVQRLLASVYSLVGASLERYSIRVDCRLILLDYDRGYDYGHSDRWQPRDGTPATSSLVKLPVLAASKRPWTHVLAVEGEQGERIFRQFLTLSNERPYTATRPRWQNDRVRGGLVLQRAASADDGAISDGNTSAGSYAQVLVSEIQELNFDSRIILSMVVFLAFYPFNNTSSQSNSSLVIWVGEHQENGSGTSLESAKGLPASKSLRAAIEEFLLAIVHFSAVSQPVPFPDNDTVVHLAPDCFLNFVANFHPQALTIGPESTAAFLVQSSSKTGAIAMNKTRRDRGLPEFAIFEVFGFTTDELDTDEDIDRAQSSSSSRAL